MGSRRDFRFHEGCLDHKWQTSYRRLWMVMKRNVIYIFRDRPFIPENHEGTLTIDGTTKFEIQKEKPSNYKFLLTTGNRRVNVFKSDKKSERDLWRGYIVGVSKQKVPDDLDLPRDVINKIKSDVANLHLEMGTDSFDTPSRHSNNSNTGSGPRHSISIDRHDQHRQSTFSDDSGVVSRRSLSSGSGSMTIDGVGGGPFMRHKFSNNGDNIPIPSWFFEACTREKAESYLAIAAENNLGDTLMRESTKFKQDGSYVISKRNVKQGMSSVEHYEVIRVDRGYKIKVENPHEAMKNLSEVMEYFIKTSGALATVPLKTNRSCDFGMVDDPYNTGRIQPTDTVADILSEPPPDYEEPVKSPARPPMQRPKTVSQSSSKTKHVNFHAQRYSYNTERMVKDNHGREAKPSLDDITNNIKAAAAIHMFDQTIEPFDERAKAEDYINLKDLQRQAEEFQSLPPPPAPHIPAAPPPQPHPPLPARNNDMQPPVEPAPPPPRHERSKSVPDFADQIRNVQLTRTEPTVTANKIPAIPTRPIPSIPTDGVTKDPRDGVPSPSQLGLRPTNLTKPDTSVGENTKPTGKKSILKTQSLDVGSTNVPSPQQMGLKQTKSNPPITESVAQPTTDVAPEIDESHPGGVSSLASRFERKASEEAPISPKQTTAKTLPKPTACANMSDKPYQNVSSRSNSTENPYDDGITPNIIPAPCGSSRPRSKSTPTISPEIRHQLSVSRVSTGNSFIRKLNEVVGGQQQVRSPITPGRASHQYEEDIYEKLPD